MTTKVIRASLSFLYTLFNLLFPKRFAPITFDNLYLQMNESNSYIDVFYSLKYKDNTAKKILWRFKYFLDQDALQICTYILYDQLVADASDKVTKIPFRGPHILLHYPSSTYFKSQKTFDHMKELTLLLDSLQDIHNPFFICCTHAVLPNQDVPEDLESQHTGSRKQRFEWSKKRFRLSPKFEKFMQCRLKTAEEFGTKTLRTHISRISHIYCIDDVVTTGASMQALSDILQKKYNVKISKFCICH